MEIEEATIGGTAPGIAQTYADPAICDVGPKSYTEHSAPQLSWAAMSRLLALVACALAAACATTPIPGTYESIIPAGSDRGEHHIRVTLKPEGAAAVSSAFSERPSRFLAEGTWEWDPAIWGAAGPGVLFRVNR